jgi:hypothetical protein
MNRVATPERKTQQDATKTGELAAIIREAVEEALGNFHRSSLDRAKRVPSHWTDRVLAAVGAELTNAEDLLSDYYLEQLFIAEDTIAELSAKVVSLGGKP